MFQGLNTRGAKLNITNGYLHPIPRTPPDYPLLLHTASATSTFASASADSLPPPLLQRTRTILRWPPRCSSAALAAIRPTLTCTGRARGQGSLGSPTNSSSPYQVQRRRAWRGWKREGDGVVGGARGAAGLQGGDDTRMACTHMPTPNQPHQLHQLHQPHHVASRPTLMTYARPCTHTHTHTHAHNRRNPPATDSQARQHPAPNRRTASSGGLFSRRTTANRRAWRGRNRGASWRLRPRMAAASRA